MKKIILSAVCAIVLVGCSTYDSNKTTSYAEYESPATAHSHCKKCTCGKKCRCGKFGMEKRCGDMNK